MVQRVVYRKWQIISFFGSLLSSHLLRTLQIRMPTWVSIKAVPGPRLSSIPKVISPEKVPVKEQKYKPVLKCPVPEMCVRVLQIVSAFTKVIHENLLEFSASFDTNTINQRWIYSNLIDKLNVLFKAKNSPYWTILMLWSCELKLISISDAIFV